MHATPSSTRLRAREAAAFLDVNPNTLYRWTNERRIGCYRIANRFEYTREHLDLFLQKREVPALESAA